MMQKRETFRDYFRRARTDSGVRAHLLENAKYSCSLFRVGVIVFGILAIWQCAYQRWHDGVWISRSSIFYILSFTANWLIYDKFRDRVAVLAALDEAPNQSKDPTA
jgi:hypothetical protein